MSTALKSRKPVREWAVPRESGTVQVRNAAPAAEMKKPSASEREPERKAGDGYGKGRGKNIAVTHPERGEFVARGVKDRLQAVQQAAKEWGLQWSAIARECSFREV